MAVFFFYVFMQENAGRGRNGKPLQCAMCIYVYAFCDGCLGTDKRTHELGNTCIVIQTLHKSASYQMTMECQYDFSAVIQLSHRSSFENYGRDLVYYLFVASSKMHSNATLQIIAERKRTKLRMFRIVWRNASELKKILCHILRSLLKFEAKLQTDLQFR